MKAGNVGVQRYLVGLLALILMLTSGLSSLAQTPDISCGNDSLFLISPDAVLMEQQLEGRYGLVVSWGGLDLEQATCFTILGSDTLDYPVEAEGGFGDTVDRQLLFAAPEAGEVGHQGSDPLQVTWTTEGSTINGVLSGILNLANNGGILVYDRSSETWSQENTALPKTWRQTNTVALDSGTDGFMAAAFSSGQTLNSAPRGLFINDGLGWTQIAEDIFTTTLNISWISISPNNSDHFAVGTENRGLYVTRDGGQTFENWSANLDPDFENPPTSLRIGSLKWAETRLWVWATNLGLFYSEDNGVSFDRSVIEVLTDLDDPDAEYAMPLAINEITVDPADQDHVLIGLEFHGVFQSFDGGVNWADCYGDLHVPDPELLGSWIYSAYTVLVDPDDANLIVAGMKNKGLYRTADGGTTWTLVGADVSSPNLSNLRQLNLLASDDVAGEYFCLQDEWKLLTSTDYGVTWMDLPNQPYIPMGSRLVLDNNDSGGFLMASWGGGMYEAGVPLPLHETYDSGTSTFLRDLDLGITLSFDEGTVRAGNQFTLKCQTFQGWAVWRAPHHSPENMTLIGLYDRVNPEACIEGYCGDNNFEVVPQCYNSKRAACFNFDTPDTVRFFDDDVYNGFSYYYAVSCYDYGNTALSSPQNSSQIAVYSPRWTGDELSPFTGGGNRTHILLNEQATYADYGPEIYVYPNPLREDAGLPGQEGETVVFTNLPPDSRVRVFTPAGDDVINLGPDNLHGGNIFWRTRNRDGERVAAGVFLYKVEMPSREDYWGKLIIIR